MIPRKNVFCGSQAIPSRSLSSNLVISRKLRNMTGIESCSTDNKSANSRTSHSYPLIRKDVPITKFKNPGTFEREEAFFDERTFAASGRRHCIHNYIRIQRNKMQIAAYSEPKVEENGSNLNHKSAPSKRTKNSENTAFKSNIKVPKSNRKFKMHGSVLRGITTRAHRTHDSLGLMIAIIAKFKENNLVIFDDIKCEVRGEEKYNCFPSYFYKYFLIMIRKYLICISPS